MKTMDPEERNYWKEHHKTAQILRDRHAAAIRAKNDAYDKKLASEHEAEHWKK